MQNDPLANRSVGARSSADDVFADLFQKISTGHLRAFDRLPPEDQLAAQYDVAPMTLRQALAQLRELGFVETRRGRTGGTYVRGDIGERLEAASKEQRVTVEALQQLTDWRRAISGEASALAALRATPEELVELRRLSDEYHAIYRVRSERRLADARFHVFIAKLSRNTRLIHAEKGIQETLTRILDIFPTQADAETQTSAEHRGLVEAIEQGDAERARKELSDHIDVTYQWSIHQPSVVGRATQSAPSEEPTHESSTSGDQTREVSS